MAIQAYKDIGYAIEYEPHEHYVEFVIYELDGWDEENDAPLYHKAKSSMHPDPVESHEESEAFASGSIKWDGCSNWNIDENDRGMLHFCGVEGIQDMNKAFERCYALAEELMPAWLT